MHVLHSAGFLQHLNVERSRLKWVVVVHLFEFGVWVLDINTEGT